jgi:hypothetical protein
MKYNKTDSKLKLEGELSMLKIIKTKNRYQFRLLFLMVVVLCLLAGCGTAKPSQGGSDSNDNDSGEMTILTSNLTDEGSCSELDAVMEAAGVSEVRRTVFWNHVDQFNQCDGITGLTDGYENISVNQPKYDSYDLQDAWDASYPDFVGYNCRITAFSLIGDYITIADTDAPDDSTLFMDEDALQADDSALFADDDLDRFLALFSVIEAEDTNDSARQAEVVQQAWQERGITFDDSVPMSLITVFFHDRFSEDENELMIGHAGVLFDSGTDGLYFVEKLAFQEPYRVTKFTSRSELKEYLSAVYDVQWGQTTARPFVLENGNLI